MHKWSIRMWIQTYVHENTCTYHILYLYRTYVRTCTNKIAIQTVWTYVHMHVCTVLFIINWSMAGTLTGSRIVGCQRSVGGHIGPWTVTSERLSSGQNYIMNIAQVS